MSTLELREQVHEVVESLTDEQLKALLVLLRVFNEPTKSDGDAQAEAAKREALKRIVQRMAAHPLAANAPRLTREELHERR